VLYFLKGLRPRECGERRQEKARWDVLALAMFAAVEDKLVILAENARGQSLHSEASCIARRVDLIGH